MGNRRLTSRTRRIGALLIVAVLATSCEWEPGGAEREWWCDPTDTAVNDGHGSGAHAGHEFPYTEPKGPLTGAQCWAIDVQLTAAAAIAAQFPTKSIAEANGWHWLAPWIAGQGTHHVNESRQVTSVFDPSYPTMLMFDGNGPHAPLTGMVFAVESGHMPPAGFAGDNDHWHNHQMLCYIDKNGPFVVGDGISDEQCAARGGTNVDASDTWLLHVWLPVYDGWQATDIFNKTHPGVN